MREFGPETYPVGEVGILEDVRKFTPKNHCYLAIKYNGSRYVGIIQCDDRDFFEKLYHCLSHACGQPLHEIGELDLDQSVDRSDQCFCWTERLRANRSSGNDGMFPSRGGGGFEHTSDGKNCRT